MVFSSLDPARQTYHLWHRFSMPTDHGSRDAVAVPADVADQLNSAYTFMVQMIIISLWTILILGGVILFLGKEKHTHNSGVIATGIWNSKGSPSAVFSLTAAYFAKVKDRRRWQLLLWTVVALGFVVAIYAIPIKVAPYIIIANAAPVSAAAVYVPSLLTTNAQVNAVQVNALEAPSALRAAGSVQGANATGKAQVVVDPPVLIEDLGDGEAIIQMGYRYNITGVDFGLQHYPHLNLSVEGSCQTDYSWLVANSTDASGIVLDEYQPFNDPTLESQNVSLYDSARPLAYFLVDAPSPTGPAGNWTWGAIISSVQRQSFSPGFDPWYLTDADTTGNFLVRAGRPALSCWQNDVWIYHGHESTVIALNSTDLPGLNLSPALQSIFARFLGLPKITTVATRLGASALVSTDTGLGEVFDAGSSSFHTDIERLIYASYIATMNTLTDTTMFSANNYGIPNDAVGSDGQPSPGVDEFVIWSSHVRTLSVLALIIIPVMTLVMWLIVYALTNLPFSWYRIQALQATVLYSCLHEKATGHTSDQWQRQGDRPYVASGDVEQAVFRPRFDRGSRTLSWGASERRETTMGIPTPLSPDPTTHLNATTFPFSDPVPEVEEEYEREKSVPAPHVSDAAPVTPPTTETIR